MSQRAEFARPGLLTAGAFAGAVGYLLLLGWAMRRGSYDVWPALAAFPFVVGGTVVLVTRGARREGDQGMARLLAAAAIVKLVIGTLVRYAVVFGVYGGVADATGYHGAGRLIANSLRRGDFAVDLGGGSEGTRAINLITGLIYTVTGPTKLGGFLVFSWLAFIGLFLIYRGYRLAFPEGDHRRFALLLFFLPTVVFWPSSLGKEAWMMFTLGIAVYGAARLFAQRPFGFVLLGAGLAGMGVVRPHFAVLIFAGVCMGYLLRRSRPGRPMKPLGIVVLVVVGLLVVTRFQSYFNLDDLSGTSVEQLLEQTQSKSTKGGSSFDAVGVSTNPLLLPVAAFSVLFRPFPFEANNAQALVASLEGVALAAVFVARRRSLWASLRRSVHSPFLALCMVYSLLFIVGFSSIGNFGILTRQRSLLYPLIVVLLTVPEVRRHDRVPSPSLAGSAGLGGTLTRRLQ